MAINILPRVAQDPVRSQTGGVSQGVEPVRDQTGRGLVGLGQGVQELGVAATRNAVRLQDDIDIGASAKLINDLQGEAIRVRQEYGQLRGQDAIGDAHKRAVEDFRTKKSKLAAMAQNATQRDNFNRLAADIEMRTVAALDERKADSARVLRAGQMEALAQLGQLDYLDRLGSGSMDGAEVAKRDSLRAIEDRGKTLGWSDEETEFEKRQWLNATHARAVSALSGSKASGAVSTAAKYLAAHGGEMSADVRERLSRVVQEAALDQSATAIAIQASEQVQREFAEARSRRSPEYALEPPTELERSDAWDRMRGVVDEQVSSGKITMDQRDAAIARLDKEQDQSEKRMASRRVLLERQAREFLVANPGATVQSMPPDLLAAIRETGLSDAVNSFSSANNRTTDTPDGLDRMRNITDVDLRMMSEDQLRAGFLGKLSDKNMDRLVARHKAANGDERARRVVTDLQRVENKAREAGLDEKADPATWNAFIEQFDAKLLLMQEDGKRAGDKEFADILNRHAIEWAESKAQVEGIFGWSSEVPMTDYSKLTGSEFVQTSGGNVFLRDIPEDVYRAINATLIKAGRPTTPQSIASEWVAAGKPKQVRR